MFRDPLFGPVIAFGSGGTQIEVTRDTTLEFPPLNRFLAQRMVERTRVAETLREFRGGPAIDFEQLETLLVRVSEMVCELPWIAEMDINPVIADENGIVAVDARVVIDPSMVTKSITASSSVALAPGITRGMTLVDPSGRLGTPKITFVEEVDIGKIDKLYAVSAAYSPNKAN